LWGARDSHKLIFDDFGDPDLFQRTSSSEMGEIYDVLDVDNKYPHSQHCTIRLWIGANGNAHGRPPPTTVGS
jgi:hypothetical protein